MIKINVNIKIAEIYNKNQPDKRADYKKPIHEFTKCITVVLVMRQLYA